MPNDQIISPALTAIQPGAYSAVDASAVVSAAPQDNAPVIGIVATALGGAPNVPLYFRGPASAKQLLRPGSIGYDLVRFAFGAGASRVCFVRVGNSPTKSTLALAGSGGAVVTLSSIDYGSWTTGIKVQVKASNVVVVTYTDPSGNIFTETFDLSGVATPTAQQIADAINGKGAFSPSRLVTAVAGAGTQPLTVAAATAMTGGTDGLTPAAGDWTSGLAALEPEEIDLLLVGTGDATVHAQAQTHCVNMSTAAARREREFIAGGVLGESDSTVAARMTALNQRTQLVFPGGYDFDVSGNQVLYDPWYIAAKVAGMHAALPDPATPLTHARVPIIDVERRLSTVQGGSLDTLLLAGVSPIAPAAGGGFWLVDSLTGYKAADKVFLDVHKVRSADFVQKTARVRLEARFVGQKGLSGSAQSIQTVAAQVLAELKSQEVIRGYQAPIVTPGASPTSYLVSLPVMLVDTVKFLYLTVALQPSSTVNRDTGFTSADALS